MGESQTPTDIGNRALQHCGVALMDATLVFSPSSTSKAARQIASCYGKLRRAELQRNVWVFATRRTALRAIDTNTLMLAPALWVQTTTYFVGSIVADAANNLWISRIPNNLGNPTTSAYWEPYFGPLTVSLYDSTTTYFSGELVYTTAGDGTYRVYLSLISANADNPATATAWSSTVTYGKNQVVTFASVAYMSLIALNLNQEPDISPTMWTTSFVGGTGSFNWLEIGGAEFPNGVGLAGLNITYPIGSGPMSQSITENVYRLPNGFLRRAPEDPKAGATSYLGAPGNSEYEDWNIEGKYLVTAGNTPIVLRFVADVTDVSQFDDMFCECLAGRVGMEVCEPLTQSSAKVETCRRAWMKAEADAITNNAIIVGSEEMPLDDWLACRA